jgi:hypothetical protein
VTKYTPEQIRENRRAWVRELRSEEATQTTGALANDLGDKIGFCCLGIAACILGETQLSKTGTLMGFWEEHPTGRQWHGALLPPSTRDALGFATENPRLLWHGKATSLTNLNDQAGFSFDEIAAVIDAQSDEWDGNINDEFFEYYTEEDEIPRPILQGV